jgi:hypothetical protein
MTAIRIHDPSMCCNTGVCGAEVDRRPVDCAADVRWDDCWVPDGASNDACSPSTRNESTGCC